MILARQRERERERDSRRDSNDDDDDLDGRPDVFVYLFVYISRLPTSHRTRRTLNSWPLIQNIFLVMKLICK